MLTGNISSLPGDPVRAAEILVRVVKHPNLPSHLLLGVYAASAALDYSRHQIEKAETWADVSRSADFGQPYPVELPAPTDHEQFSGILRPPRHAGN